ncbi:MAG: SPOR domain-containing protein [Oscillospiraceae bacterium]|nr:SPOR domain-containing protein [Oscillospiraceae bacterium]
MNNVQTSTMAALRAAQLNGNFVIHDLLSGQTIEFRGAAGNNNHIDVMFRTQSAFRKMLRMLNLPVTRDHGNWRARPGVLEFTNNRGTFRFAVAYHTYNHSVRVAGQPFYNPVGFRVIRGKGAIPHERTAAGSWRSGEHICVWVGDSWVLRGSRTSAWEIEMRDAVRDAERRSITATANVPQHQNQKMWRVQVAASRDRAAIEREVNRLIAAGQYAYLNIYGGFYRAQVGVFANRADANKLAAQLKQRGLVSDIFVKQA